MNSPFVFRPSNQLASTVHSQRICVTEWQQQQKSETWRAMTEGGSGVCERFSPLHHTSHREERFPAVPQSNWTPHPYLGAHLRHRHARTRRMPTALPSARMHVRTMDVRAASTVQCRDRLLVCSVQSLLSGTIVKEGFSSARSASVQYEHAINSVLGAEEGYKEELCIT